MLPTTRNQKTGQMLTVVPVPPPFPATIPGSNLTSSGPAQRRARTEGSEAQEMSL